MGKSVFLGKCVEMQFVMCVYVALFQIWEWGPRSRKSVSWFSIFFLPCSLCCYSSLCPSLSPSLRGEAAGGANWQAQVAAPSWGMPMVNVVLSCSSAACRCAAWLWVAWQRVSHMTSFPLDFLDPSKC